MFLLSLVMLVMFSVLFSIMSMTPIIIGVVLLATSFLICLLVGSCFSVLTGLFLFLIYVGGLLVIFSYMLSIFPNEELEMMVKLPFFLILFMFGFLVFLGVEWVYIGPSLMVGFMGGSSTNCLFLFMGALMLVIMVLVVQMCSKNVVPLRSVV